MMYTLRSASLALFITLAGLGCSTTRSLPSEHHSKELGRAAKVVTEDFTAYTVSIDIQAPSGKVWALLADVGSWSSWTTTIVRASGEVVAGQEVTLVSSLDKEREFTLAVAEVEAEKNLVFEDGMPLGLFAGVRTYTLSPVDGGTRFTMSEVFSGGLSGMIVDNIPDMRVSFETFAADLKKAAEQP